MNTVYLSVNGQSVDAAVEPRTSLADFLRDSHDLTGTHLGCEHGVCGACTVLVDGVPVRSCITLAASCENAEVTTVEGLDQDEIGRELRAALSREHGLQCGYCTPGMMISAWDLVQRLDLPDEQEIRVGMSGNLCRCTGYVGIVRAIRDVIRERRERGVGANGGRERKRLGPAGAGLARAERLHDRVGSERGADDAGGAAVTETVPRGVASVQPGDDWVPEASFSETFLVAHPVDVVWDFFGRIDAVAKCLPGASLRGEMIDGQVEGSLRAKVGPIMAEFHGIATLERDEEARTGTITGSGRDLRSGSMTRGRIAYQIAPAVERGQTRVDVVIGYTLTGMLAQFGRSGLVRDVASRMIDAFVGNLDAYLSGDDRTPSGIVEEVNAGSVLFGVIFDRMKRLFNRIFGIGK